MERQRFRRASVLEQDLAHKLLEVGIARVLGDKAVEFRTRPRQLRRPVIGYSAGVARGLGGVANRVARQRLSFGLDEANEFGLHERQSSHEIGILRGVVVRPGGDALAKRFNAI